MVYTTTFGKVVGIYSFMELILHIELEMIISMLLSLLTAQLISPRRYSTSLISHGFICISPRAQTVLRGVVAPCYQHHQPQVGDARHRYF